MTEWLKIWHTEEEDAEQEQTDRLNKRYQSSYLAGTNPTPPHTNFCYDSISNRITDAEEQPGVEEEIDKDDEDDQTYEEEGEEQTGKKNEQEHRAGNGSSN